jgi:hypothetical protein
MIKQVDKKRGKKGRASMGRSDGRLIKSLPPFTKIIPHLMVRRFDATNYMALEFPHDKVSEYIGMQKRQGKSLSIMSCILAAYVRTIAKYPEVNRFVVAKKIYARKGIFVSFVTLKENWDGEHERDETVVKLEFTGRETVFDVADRIAESVEENRRVGTENLMDKVLAGIFRLPVLPAAIVTLIRALDHIGLLPSLIIKASPFHTSLFFTNMASIRSFPVYHHLYQFGTTGAFISLGADLSHRGKYHLMLAADERTCSGSTYVRALRYMLRILRNLEMLEEPPEEVAEDLR